MQKAYRIAIEDSIRTLTKQFYKNPSMFKSKSDFKEHFYRICSRKKVFKKRYRYLTSIGEKVSVLRENCPIYFAERKSDRISEWDYDIAVLSPDLITRFNLRNSVHLRKLRNDSVGLLAVIEFIFITEDSDRVKSELENCYAKLDCADSNEVEKLIVAFSNIDGKKGMYFRPAGEDPGCPLFPEILCISVYKTNGGKENIELEEYPAPWFTLSKFKDRMERINFSVTTKLHRKSHQWKKDKLEKRYMPQIVEAVKNNRIVSITGHPVIDMIYAFHIPPYLHKSSTIGKRTTLWLHCDGADDYPDVILDSIADAFGILDDLKGLSLEQKEKLLKESVPEEKGLIVFHNVSDEQIIRRALGCLGHWHAVVTSRRPVVKDLVQEHVHITGRKETPAFIRKYLSRYLFGEKTKWVVEGKPKPSYILYASGRKHNGSAAIPKKKEEAA